MRWPARVPHLAEEPYRCTTKRLFVLRVWWRGNRFHGEKMGSCAPDTRCAMSRPECTDHQRCWNSRTHRGPRVRRRPMAASWHSRRKGRLSAAPESLCLLTPPQLGGVSINGLVGFASGLMMSRVAPARSVCCSVRSPRCSFSPSRTRWSVTFAPDSSMNLNLSELSYLVSEPWYFANTENGAVGNRHSAFAPHVQVWKPTDGLFPQQMS